jgi:uncharacterized protein
MHARLSVLTLAVDDLDRSLRFYRDGLGLPTTGIMGQEFEHGAVVFFDLQPGLRLALWPRCSLEQDTGLLVAPVGAVTGSLGHNVGSAAEVDVLLAQALAAGARLVKPAQTTLWGAYAGYFQDPDGHLWELVWNPEWLPT